ncbi:hypothetical protein ACFE04_017281 [Oxalis oulophora]
MVKSCDSLVLPLPLSTKNVINKNASAAVRKKFVVELSDLPEDILIRIFCFMETKFAVQTCLLFKQWNHLWTVLPTLNFNTSNVDYSFPVHLLTCQQLKVLKLRGGKLQEFVNFSTLKILHLKDVDGECFWLEDARHHQALSLSFANLEELIFHKVSLSGHISGIILTCPKLLKTANLDIYPPFKPYPWDHHDLSNIMNVFKALSMFPSLLEKEHFSFNYLRSLKVGVKNLKTPKVEANERIGSLDSIPDKVMNFLCRKTANEEILELKYETTNEEQFMDVGRYLMLDPSGDYLITRLSRPYRFRP